MSRVLFIGAGTPWQGSAGHHVRQQMLLAAARRIGRVRAVLYDDGSGRAENTPDWIESVLWMPNVGATGAIRRGLLGDVFDPVPRMVRGRAADRRREEVRGFIGAFGPEIILAYRIEFLLAAGLMGDDRVCLDIDDPEHIRRGRAAALQGGLDWRSRLDLGKLRRFERRAAQSARMCFVCNEHDALAFDPPAAVVPNAIAVPVELPGRVAGSRTVLFVGNLSGGGANADGLRWFIESVWPRVLSTDSRLRLKVVGRGGDSIVAGVGGGEGIEVAGFVDDLSAEYAKAVLAIAPIRYGTGTRIKILEAMAHGCPVVSTSVGAEGIMAGHDAEILIADNPEEFAAAIAAVAADVGRASEIGEAGRKLVLRMYGQEQVAADLARLIASEMIGSMS